MLHSIGGYMLRWHQLPSNINIRGKLYSNVDVGVKHSLNVKIGVNWHIYFIGRYSKVVYKHI